MSAAPRYLMRCEGFALSTGFGPEGLYLLSFDPDARDGYGDVRWTADPALAMTFEDLTTALELWKRPSTVRPTRDDGRPNRPLTAWTVSFVLVPEEVAGASSATFPDIEAFYRAYPAAARSVESDYGVWWRDDDGGIWRVTYVHNTGHVYAVMLSGVGATARPARIGGEVVVMVSAHEEGRKEGPVVILGQLDTFTEKQEADARRKSRGRVAPPDPAERALEGWAEVCGAQGSLAWLKKRLEEVAHG